MLRGEIDLSKLGKIKTCTNGFKMSGLCPRISIFVGVQASPADAFTNPLR